MSASVTEVFEGNALADALPANDCEAGVAETSCIVGIPVCVGSEGALAFRKLFAFSASEEVSVWAFASFVEVPNLTSSASHALGSVPSSSLWAHALDQVRVPDLSVLALSVRLA